MIIKRQLRWTLLVLSVLTCAIGCSQGSTTASNPDLPQLNDIITAPANIQTAAKAVVRVSTARNTATGSFISATGLLLTNNHVLGDSVCPTEGCYVQITSMWQRGQQRQTPQILFAVPQAVNVGLDMAVVQLYYTPAGPKFASPDYLSFKSESPSSLIGKHVTIVGHPEGHLKKWTDGMVASASGSWFTSTAFILPGDSGSPVLNDDGQIVGLIHRGSSAEDLFTADSVNVYSIGTASAQIMSAMTAPLPRTVISTAAPTTKADFLANDLVYLNAHTTTVTADGANVSALSLLGQACDTALARQDFKSPDELQSALQPCYHAQTWIDCRSDATAVSYGVVCPTGADATLWAGRFERVNQLWVDMNGQPDLYSVSHAIARLQASMSAGTNAGAQALQQAIAGGAPTLNYSLSNYLAAFGISSYDSTNIKDFVVNYKNVLHYELQATSIVSAAGWLYNKGLLQRNDYLSLLSQMYDDPEVSVGTKLYIDDLRYQMGVL